MPVIVDWHQPMLLHFVSTAVPDFDDGVVQPALKSSDPLFCVHFSSLNVSRRNLAPNNSLRVAVAVVVPVGPTLTVVPEAPESTVVDESDVPVGAGVLGAGVTKHAAELSAATHMRVLLQKIGLDVSVQRELDGHAVGVAHSKNALHRGVAHVNETALIVHALSVAHEMEHLCGPLGQLSCNADALHARGDAQTSLQSLPGAQPNCATPLHASVPLHRKLLDALSPRTLARMLPHAWEP